MNVGTIFRHALLASTSLNPWPLMARFPTMPAILEAPPEGTQQPDKSEPFLLSALSLPETSLRVPSVKFSELLPAGLNLQPTIQLGEP